MSLRKWASAAGIALAIAGSAQGCSANLGASESRLCTPGAYVFCRCADTGKGTKLCQDDGKTFAACETSDDGECVGGEVEDPDTGKEVDTEGNPRTPTEPGTTTKDLLDQCPGKPTALTPGIESIIEGDTTGAKDDMKGRDGACAAGGGGPNHVLRLQPKGSGQLSVKVQGTAPLDPTVYVRTTCDDVASQAKCSETTAAGGLEQLTLNVVAGRDYFLVIDGASGSAGKYKATLKLTTGAFCGDGKVDANEACDDGNNADGDGCSADCKKPNGDPATGNGCSGHPVDVWPNQTVTGTGSNTPYGNTWTKTTNSCTVSANNLNVGSEHVYEVNPHASGKLTVSLAPAAGVNLMLAARTTCDDPTSQAAAMCSNDGSAGGAEEMTFPVESGKKVYVAVDGAGTVGNKGSYTVTFKIQ